ncbi:Serine/threonine-protein kinase SBK1 [Orchesella cincta]|uniref:Serine/threonine-protein kinase SBK1 n=1 Tax=Orchesella cincta TaxID=48709 RepID=A0A1D2N850_ORCCI|nr:Serine/threonine-protein kinase SBK1 [Orchesella cincta]
MARNLEVPSLFPRLGGSSNDLRKSSSNTAIPSKVMSLQEVNLEKEFDVVRTLSEGSFSKVLLARQQGGGERMVLKAIHCEVTSAEDFSRELNYNYYLSPHPNIVTSYNVAFMWDNCFIYVQEYALYGDLSRHLKKGGLPEAQVKSIATQLTSAVEFIHSFQLVHRDLRPENILVFRKDLSIIKLGDFGQTRPSGVLLTKTTSNTSASYCPPEISELIVQEKYHCYASADVWSVGMILIECLIGMTPWTSAEITDPNYTHYVDWVKRKTLKTPDIFQVFTPRFIRLLKRIMEPKAAKRSKVGEITKYINDEWIIKGSAAVIAIRRASVERHESNATSKSGHRQRYYGKKRSTRSLVALESEIEVTSEHPVESVNERVGKWIDNSLKVSFSHPHHLNVNVGCQ